MTNGNDYFNLISEQLCLESYFDADGRWLPRLAYEDVADGVATLNADSQVKQPPAGSTIDSLSTGNAAGSSLLISEGGVIKKTVGNQPNGPTILDANGKIISRLAYEGHANGVATLDNAGRMYSSQRPMGLMLGNTARDHKIVAGVIRNNGTGWAQISSPHEAINIDYVSANSSNIIINYASIGVSLVHTFVAVPDETMGSDGIIVVGASVGLSQVRLRLLQLYRMSGYAYYTGSSWVWRNNMVGPTPAAIITPSLSFDTAGRLKISGGSFASWGSVTARNGPYLAQMDSVGADYITVVFRDIATGSVITTPDTNMRVFVERFTYHQLNPTTYVSSLGNIWFMGVFS